MRQKDQSFRRILIFSNVTAMPTACQIFRLYAKYENI